MTRTRASTVAKVVLYLNDIRQTLEKNPYIKRISDFSEKHQVSNACFASAQRLNYFTKIKTGTYKCNMESFDDFHAKKVLHGNSTFYINKKFGNQYKMPEIDLPQIPVQNHDISKFSDEEWLESGRRRGFTIIDGQLVKKIVKIETFNL